MRPIDICNQLNSFFAQCMADQFIEAFETHKIDSNSTHQFLGPVSPQKMISGTGITFEEYIVLLDNNSYSAVFFDASIISIQCYFDGNDIKGHRYIYIPCPVNADLLIDRPASISLADWLRYADSDKLRHSYHSSGNMRFDFSADMAPNPNHPHPVSHLTFGSPSCRIPVKAPLSPSGFLEFIFENYYRHYLQKWRHFEPHLRCLGLTDTISRAEIAKHHFSWS
tara:strand:- start:646 stop:1317 length:672 start_codon:yes stop_codon:yes gene_type:complete